MDPGKRAGGAPDRIRTCDLRLRRATLYPAELRVRVPRLILYLTATPQTPQICCGALDALGARFSRARPWLSKSDIRPGEVAIELPDGFDAGVHFIGRIRTPFKTRAECPKNTAAIGCRRPGRARCALCGRPQGPAALQPRHSCSTGWTRRGAISSSRCRRTWASRAAPSRCARRCGPTRSRWLPWSCWPSRAPRYRAQRRLHRRHAARRHQALFRLDRQLPGRQARLKRAEIALTLPG